MAAGLDCGRVSGSNARCTALPCGRASVGIVSASRYGESANDAYFRQRR